MLLEEREDLFYRFEDLLFHPVSILHEVEYIFILRRFEELSELVRIFCSISCHLIYHFE